VDHPMRRVSAWFFFFSSRGRHTRFSRDWSADVCSSDLALTYQLLERLLVQLAMPSTLNPTIQGVIIIAAVAFAANQGRARRGRAAPHTPAEPQPVGVG